MLTEYPRLQRRQKQKQECEDDRMLICSFHCFMFVRGLQNGRHYLMKDIENINSVGSFGSIY
jgi:hypothetical protein